MPLTRSLYREDEVIASIKWCIIKGRFTEALFWSQEAIDSNMVPELLKALVWVWLFACGPNAISWITRLKKTDYINTVISLLYHVKNNGDNATFALLGIGLCKRSKEPIITLFDTGGLPQTPIVRALLQGKADLSWNLLRPNWENGWETITSVAAVKHPHCIEHLKLLDAKTMNVWEDEWTWLLRAFATNLVCKSSVIIQEEPESYRILGEYIPHTNLTMRKRRFYEIPLRSLYWFAKRGDISNSQTTEDELLNLEDALGGSKYWSPMLPIGYDIEREDFYHTHFPDDIPDEWSIKDRMLSHGYGTATVHRAALNNCLIRWFSKLPCSIWKGFEIALEEFNQRWENRPESLEKGIHEAYEEKDIDSWIHEMEAWSLNPRKRKFTVV